jgi:hypothetical protein
MLNFLQIKERSWIRGIGQGCSWKGEKFCKLQRRRKENEGKKKRISHKLQIKLNFAWYSRLRISAMP